MGCLKSRRAHVNAKDAKDLQNLLNEEESYLTELIKESKNDQGDTLKLHYVNTLHLIKSCLTQLNYKIEKIRDKINSKTTTDWKEILDLLDRYYDLKDKNFIEKDDIAYYDDKNSRKTASPIKEFIKSMEEYAAFENE
jgi:hypothetical protein